MKNTGFQKERRSHTVLTVVFVIIAVAYLYPIFIVLVNSLKTNAAINLDTFAFPTSNTFMGLQNYIKGMTFGNYPFYKSVEYSLMITLLSAALILICTSMAAWYISRVDSLVCRIVYYLCVFSMVVPFQMVMFTLAKTADTLKLNRPWTIPIVYLGFGAGLAVFMFTGFVKSIPRSIEEAAVIDGAGPLSLFFKIIMPLLKPTMVTCFILQFMTVCSDFLTPLYLSSKSRLFPMTMAVYQFFGKNKSYWNYIFADIVLTCIPVIIVYMIGQKYNVGGMTSGAVKE